MLLTDSVTSLGSRTGLPDDLLVLLKAWPRETWQANAKLGETARFWLQRHDMFRELGATLEQSIGEYRAGHMDAQPFAQFFVPRLQFFLQQLHGHHQIEDTHYFPVFQQAERRLARGFDILENDHHAIHDALAANAEAANAFLGVLGQGRDAARFAADAYAANAARLVSLLTRHLADEEDLIIPLILDRGEDALGI